MEWDERTFVKTRRPNNIALITLDPAAQRITYILYVYALNVWYVWRSIDRYILCAGLHPVSLYTCWVWNPETVHVILPIEIAT